MGDVIFESPGEWWLPAQEPRRIPGMMRIDAKGDLRIHLFKTLDDESTGFGPPTRRPVLLGSLHESPLPGGSEVTHFDSFAVRRSLRWNGTSAETLVANRSYVGDEHLEAADRPFAKYAARVTGLAAWLPFSAVGRSATGGKVRIEVKKPMSFGATVGGAHMDFVKAAEVSFSDEETTVRERAHVDFVLDAGRIPDDFVRELLVPLRNLVSLALGETMRINNLDIVLGEEGPWPIEVHDLEVWARATRASSVASVRSSDTLIAPPRDEAELQRLATAWWDVNARMPRAVERIFAVLQAPPEFIEVRFGAVSDAFELLAQSLPSSPQARVMIEALGTPITSALPPVGQVIERWKTASKRLRSGESADVQELLRLSQILSWLMRFVLLQQLGVDLGRASAAPGFRHAASQFETS